MFGMVLFGQTIHHSLEIAITYLIIWGRDRKLRHIVGKNLASHLRRNRQTSLMFSTCLAYVILASTMFSLQTNSLSSLLSWVVGADVTVTGRGIKYPLPGIFFCNNH